MVLIFILTTIILLKTIFYSDGRWCDNVKIELDWYRVKMKYNFWKY